MSTDNYFTPMVNDVFHSVTQAIGIHVMLLVVERALWQTRSKYEEASLITYSEEGICLDGLADLAPERSKLVMYSFIMSIIATLGHLVGGQIANQLIGQLEHLFRHEG